MLNLKTSMTRSVIKEARAQIDKSLKKLRDRVHNGPTVESTKRLKDALVKLQARTINERLILKEKEANHAAKQPDTQSLTNQPERGSPTKKSRPVAGPRFVLKATVVRLNRVSKRDRFCFRSS